MQCFQRQAVHRAQQFLGHRVEPFHKAVAILQLTPVRTVFEVRRHGTRFGGERRQYSAKLVGGLAQARCVPFPQGVLNPFQLVREAVLERLANLAEDYVVARTGGQEHPRVE